MIAIARASVLVLACAGCAGNISDGPGPGDDAANGCQVFLTFDPPSALAGPGNELRAMANVQNAPGILAYTWQVRYAGSNVPYQAAQADGSAIRFPTAASGVYDVLLLVEAPIVICPTAQADVNVGEPGGNMVQVRLRVFPPAGVQVPPSERLVLVPGGADYSLGAVVLDPGVVATGTVQSEGTGIRAYLRFIPLGGRDAYVEAFSGEAGAFSARVQNQLHDVLVIPLVPDVPPKLVASWMPGTQLVNLEPAVTIAGVVRDPGNAEIAGAKVRVSIDGVPSTLATTLADGTFTVRARPAPAGATIAVEVTPPPATGLPRLVASAVSPAIDPSQSIAVRYDATLAVRSLAGVTVRRGGAAQANAKVTVAGTLAAIGTVTAGPTPITAHGEVRISATANGAGALPGMLAPAASLFAVVDLGAGDLAVAGLDLTATVPPSISAPAMVPRATQLRDPGLTGIAGVRLELVPTGALAIAGVGAILASSGSGGAVAASLASGGHYELRASDPAGRGAPLVMTDVTADTLAASYTLPPALRLEGSLMLSGNPAPVGRAAVQIRCTQCTGVDRTRPLAEGSSTSAGEFSLAVLDPGTN